MQAALRHAVFVVPLTETDWIVSEQFAVFPVVNRAFEESFLEDIHFGISFSKRPSGRLVEEIVARTARR
jgi:hypothetical protein